MLTTTCNLLRFARGWLMFLRSSSPSAHAIAVRAAWPLLLLTCLFPIRTYAQGGLTNGGNHSGSISTPHEVDTWTFEAAKGDSITLSVAEVVEGETDPGFYPSVRLIGPNGGDDLASAYGRLTAEIIATVPLSGTYTVLVADYYRPEASYFGAAVANYKLRFAKAHEDFLVPLDDEGGTLTNGFNHAGKIEVGDIDLWKFEAAKGDSVTISLAELLESETDPGFYPSVRLIGPNGGDDLASAYGRLTAEIIATVPLSGTYTVLVADYYRPEASYFGAAASNYKLHFAKAHEDFLVPLDDEGGTLTNGFNHAGKIDVGDIDLWKFEAAKGDSVTISLAELLESETDPGFYPSIRLIGPNGGDDLALAYGRLTAEIIATVPLSGTYTVLVADYYRPEASYFGAAVANYKLRFAKAHEDFLVPLDDEGGTLTNGFNHAGKIEVGDIDLWKFEAAKGDSITISLAELLDSETDPGFYPSVRLIGPNGGDDLASAYGRLTAEITATAPLSGTYTVLVADYYRPEASYFGAATANYRIRRSSRPPDLLVPDGLSIIEEDKLTAEISAADPEFPTKPLTFELLSGPPGATLASTTATNATIAWTPSEATGPSTNVFVARVTDTVNGTAYRKTNSFTVVVQEVNSPPQLVLPPTQSIEESTPFAGSASAIDSDIPTNPLSFSLASAPEGMTIDSATGAISWTPTEAQGPSTNTVAVVVTDNNPYAVDSPQLSTTNVFTVIVRERNLPPQLNKPADSVVDELVPFRLALQASDPDLPANPLDFTLLTAPPGMTINSSSGLISWTPSEEDGPGTNLVVVAVRDNGDPVLSATNSFTLAVREANSAPVLPAIADQESADDSVFRFTVKATDSDRPANTLTYELGAGAPAGVSLDPATGELTYPIGVKLSPETLVIPFKVTDNGIPPLSTEGSLRILVRPALLRLAALPDRSIDEQSLLTLTASVTNSAQATPPFTFALEGSIPTGATLNPTTGVFFWRPSEVQGPSTNTFVVRVTDNAVPQNSAVESFSVVVGEMNTAPVLAPIVGQRIIAGGMLTVTAVATDPDVPANQLSFSLGTNAPPGMSIGSESGIVQWTPGLAYAGTTNRVTVSVRDDGTPPLESAQTLVVTVQGLTDIRLNADLVAADQLRLRLTGDVGRTYLIESSTDLRSWNTFTNYVSTSATADFIIPAPPQSQGMFFRAISP